MGKLRVFFAGKRGEYNGAEIKVYFPNKPEIVEHYPSILNHASDIYALDEFKLPAQIVTAVPYRNDEDNWFYADFGMAYDPCTCLFESTMVIEVKMIDKATITLEGSIDATLASIEDGEGTVSEDGYSVNELVAAGESAYKAYKSTNSFVQKQKKNIDKAKKATGKIDKPKAEKKKDVDNFVNEFLSDPVVGFALDAAPYVSGALDLN